jgi:hypothetical protein
VSWAPTRRPVGAAAEYARSAIKGLDYEEFVTQVVGDIAAVHGDRAERSGAIEGLRQGDKRLAKRGDVTIWLGDQPAIVFEIKDRLRLSSAAVQRELEEAMENRSAEAAILVVSNNQNNLMSQQPLVFLREDMWAVHQSKEEPDPLALQVAYLLAREAALAKARHGEFADLDLIQAYAEEIMRRLTPLADIRLHINNSLGSQEKASAALVSFERELRAAVLALIDLLSGGAGETAA